MSDHTVEFRVAWQHHVSTDLSRLEGVLARHRERHRRYHGVDHVAWTVRHVAELADEESVADVDAIVAAAFYHDAVYEPTYPANERASARLAAGDLAALGWPPDRIAHVVAMIEATATHLDAVRPEVDVDTAVLLDADLAVLAADPAGYAEYTTGIRAEHRHLDDAEWRAGRTAVAQALADREPIYASESGRRRWEHRARANLTTELASLAS